MLGAFALDVISGFAHTLMRVLPYMAVMGVAFAGLSFFTPCNPGQPWWKKRGLVTDLCYWFIVPVFTRYARIGFTVLVTVYLLGINTANGLVAYFDHGHGPISRLPFWVQLGLYLVAHRIPALLDPPRLPFRLAVEVPRRAPLVAGRRVDFRLALSSRQPDPGHGPGRRRRADVRHHLRTSS